MGTSDIGEQLWGLKDPTASVWMLAGCRLWLYGDILLSELINAGGTPAVVGDPECAAYFDAHIPFAL